MISGDPYPSQPSMFFMNRENEPRTPIYRPAVFHESGCILEIKNRKKDKPKDSNYPANITQ